jgi:hypothetical protein
VARVLEVKLCPYEATSAIVSYKEIPEDSPPKSILKRKSFHLHGNSSSVLTQTGEKSKRNVETNYRALGIERRTGGKEKLKDYLCVPAGESFIS